MQFIKYECENCSRKFGVEADLEEPACPECGETNCAELE
ncbi:DNA-directed RNA polymerase subunit RPC12/RpoP [Paenibacillus sp. SORGH_AS306]|nr:DNA-directed RNA polymerase subunit RPC12/RpoP [Paenibacillus sp. SORGH_AS_0306]MDR6110367.1 DNA-directed RNA polymerase subunit RPC12/RpoP [Paenibacillus sp. SORGH_AS_0338]